MAASVKFNPWHAPEMQKVVGWSGARKKGKGRGKGTKGKRKGGKAGSGS